MPGHAKPAECSQPDDPREADRACGSPRETVVLDRPVERRQRAAREVVGDALEIDEPEKLRASRNPIVRDFLEGRPFKSIDEETGVGTATQMDITTT